MREFGQQLNMQVYYQSNMIKRKKRKHRKFAPEKEYIIMTEDCMVFSGLKGGYPVFSENLDDAKPFINISQTEMLQLVSPIKLEIVWL